MTDPQNQPLSAPSLQPRSQLAGTVASLVCWAVVIFPIIAFSLVMFAMATDPANGIATIGKVSLIAMAVVLLFCMISAPHFVGQAVVHRERAMWRAALVTGIPTVGVIMFLVFRWLANG